jgi:hypothetical protein
VALLRFNGSVSDLSLLTIGGYYYYNSHDKKDRVVGLAWLHYFPCPCRLRTVRCIGH